MNHTIGGSMHQSHNLRELMSFMSDDVEGTSR
jgi:hypothetical protein